MNYWLWRGLCHWDLVRMRWVLAVFDSYCQLSAARRIRTTWNGGSSALALLPHNSEESIQTPSRHKRSFSTCSRCILSPSFKPKQLYWTQTMHLDLLPLIIFWALNYFKPPWPPVGFCSKPSNTTLLSASFSIKKAQQETLQICPFCIPDKMKA